MKSIILHHKNCLIILTILIQISFFPLILKADTHQLIDNDGIIHRFSSPFKRIISLYPAHTENLAEMGAADSLIGISTTDDYPNQILNIKQYSYHDSIEKFIQARADCILIRPMIRNSARSLVETLEDYGITVISLQPRSPDELYKYWSMLGLISGKSKEAEDMITSFKADLQNLEHKVALIPSAKQPHVYFESIHSRMKTFSPDSITMFCLKSAGGINVAIDAVSRRNSNIAAYSKERIIYHADSIDVFLAQKGRMNPVSVHDIKNESGFGAIKAIKNNQIFLIDEIFVSRPTTRLIQGMLQIYKRLYPAEPTQL